MVQQTIRHDAMRIGGEKIKTDAVVDVRYLLIRISARFSNVRRPQGQMPPHEPKLHDMNASKFCFRHELGRAARKLPVVDA